MLPPRFSLRQLSYFIAVAEAGSIRVASERLHVSPTALSQALDELDRELGTRLLARRRAHGARLTEAGARVIGETRAVLDAAADVHAAAQGWQRGMSGQLSVGCYTTMAPSCMPRLFAEFRRRHPGIELRMIEGSNDELAAGIRQGTCEIALMYRFGLGDDMARQVLHELRPLIVIANDHPLAAQAEIDLRLLAAEPFILFDVAPATSNTLEVFERADVVPSIAYRTTNFELVRTLAGQGLGYSILLQRPAIDIAYDGSRIAMRPIAGDHSRYPVVVAWAKSERLSRRGEAFLTMCVELAPDLFGHQTPSW